MQDECDHPTSRLATIDFADRPAPAGERLDVAEQRYPDQDDLPDDSGADSIPLLLRLPPELLETVLDNLSPAEMQRTALALLKVFPDGRLSQRHLWRHLVVRRKQQLMPLWHKLKAEGKMPGGGALKWVNSFTQESWQGDVDILNNVLRCLPDIRVLMLNVGTNFAPEHLEEMFEDPREDIQRMEMRFRPYVEQATYYQFLKGSYFDTAIETLTRNWPETPSFKQLSIVQDLPPRSTAPPTAYTTAANSIAPSAVPSVVASAVPSALTTRVNSLSSSLADLAVDSPASSDSEEASGQSTPPTSVGESPVEPKGYSGHGPFPYLSEKFGFGKPKSFAQPIVFFDIKCITAFAAAPVAANLTHLRLRVPSRDIAHVLLRPHDQPVLVPSLRFLDISTTNVRMDAFAALVRYHTRLEHLVLDRVNLFGFQAKDRGPELCRELGDKAVSAGLVRGKERERQIAAWDLQQRVRSADAEARRRDQQVRDQQARVAARGSQRSDDDGSEGEGDEDEDDEAAAARREAAAAALADTRAAEAAEAERQRLIAAARARRGHRSAAHSTFSLRDRPSRRTTSTTVTRQSDVPVPPADTLYLVLPPLPTLKTLSVGGEAHNLSAPRVREWEENFHAGWRDGLGKVVGWAHHVVERYDRAVRKAEEWHAQEVRAAASGSGTSASTKGKGKAKAMPKPPVGTRPPTRIRLFRYPEAGEPASRPHPSDPTLGLIEITSGGTDDDESGVMGAASIRDVMERYKLAQAAAELHQNGQGPPACAFCTVPDCEGPMRRGDEGARVDGRGGMSGKHRQACGHMLGRATWGWGSS